MDDNTQNDLDLQTRKLQCLPGEPTPGREPGVWCSSDPSSLCDLEQVTPSLSFLYLENGDVDYIACF